MSDEQTGIFDMTAATPMLWPNLHEPKAYQENGKDKGEKKYGATFIFGADHPDMKAIKDKAIAVARARWPGVELKTVSWPFTSGNDYATKREAAGKKDGDRFKGKALLKARSIYEPRLCGVENGGLTDYEGDARLKSKPKFYSGVGALAEFNFVAVEVKSRVNGVEVANKFVTAYLNMVFTTNKGERVGGGRSAAETFKGYAGQATVEDPTKGAVDDEIPF